ncbi:hypothetical protein RchiOBHm_Chr3g0488311 [Rosa chinensis]|uniref:Uncharacterized protein n=1 Tax=Rosa chinensis TaxID=74649 RepID=A0A2P6RFS8_ROSCH|nr:hypothetical protein RchiOBHm_Chr3g0488311 [Rosa chinensis]
MVCFTKTLVIWKELKKKSNYRQKSSSQLLIEWFPFQLREEIDSA